MGTGSSKQDKSQGEQDKEDKRHVKAAEVTTQDVEDIPEKFMRVVRHIMGIKGKDNNDRMRILYRYLVEYKDFLKNIKKNAGNIHKLLSSGLAETMGRDDKLFLSSVLVMVSQVQEGLLNKKSLTRYTIYEIKH